jgi:hypothetical protein
VLFDIGAGGGLCVERAGDDQIVLAFVYLDPKLSVGEERDLVGCHVSALAVAIKKKNGPARMPARVQGGNARKDGGRDRQTTIETALHTLA